MSNFSHFLGHVIIRDAQDGGFRYPAGYRIGRIIVKDHPAGK